MDSSGTQGIGLILKRAIQVRRLIGHFPDLLRFAKQLSKSCFVKPILLDSASHRARARRKRGRKQEMIDVFAEALKPFKKSGSADHRIHASDLEIQN